MKKDINNLEKIQLRATKMIEECRGLNYEDRLRVSGLTKLVDRRDRGHMIEVFKITKGLDSVDYHQHFFSSRLHVELEGINSRL